MYTFYVIPDIEYYTGKYVKYKREAYCQERGVNKKQPDFISGNIKLAPKVGAYPKRVAFEKCEYPLQHINLYF